LPTIDITPETYQKLQTLGTAFIDTPETVIARLADEALVRRRTVRVRPDLPVLDSDWIDLDPFFTGNLAHTRVRRATFDNQDIDPPQWNNLLRVAHVEAKKRLGSFAAVKQASSARIWEGKLDERGFKFVPEANLSIQGLDSNLSWGSSLRLAKKLGVSIEVEFDWHEKDGAAHPGKRGHIRWEPAVD
jgi:hypothetical protein